MVAEPVDNEIEYNFRWINILSMKEALLLVHPTFGMLSAMAAIWVTVETVNISEHNLPRIRLGSVMTAILMVITWISGGYWYVVYYATDKATILAGPWAWAHNLVMESKEHLFFIALVLSLFLPIIALGNNLSSNKSARIVTLTTAVLIVLSALALEGMGALISLGVKVGLMHVVGTH